MAKRQLTVSASLNKRFSKGQSKASSSTSDDEDAIVKLSDMSVQLADESTRGLTDLEFSKAVRWLRLSC
jgi:hypothetical protein